VGLHPVLVGGKHYVCADAGASVDKYYLGGKSSASVRAGQGVLDVQSMIGAWDIICIGQCLAMCLPSVLLRGRHYVCADAGASVDKYYLGGKSSSSVRAGQGVLDVQSMAAARAPDGRLLVVFTIGMPQDAAALSADRPIM